MLQMLQKRNEVYTQNPNNEDDKKDWTSKNETESDPEEDDIESE